MDYTDGEKIAAATLAAAHFRNDDIRSLDKLYADYLSVVRQHRTPPEKEFPVRNQPPVNLADLG